MSLAVQILINKFLFVLSFCVSFGFRFELYKVLSFKNNIRKKTDLLKSIGGISKIQSFFFRDNQFRSWLKLILSAINTTTNAKRYKFWSIYVNLMILFIYIRCRLLYDNCDAVCFWNGMDDSLSAYHWFHYGI